MAVTNEKSTQMTNLDASPPVKLEARQAHGKTRVFAFDFTQGAAAGDATSTALLARIPANSKVIGHLSKVYHSAFGAARTLDVGYKAYTDVDGTAVAADPNFFASAVDVALAGSFLLDESDTQAAQKGREFNGQADIDAVVAVDTIPVGATLNGFVIYSVE